ncbi:DUF4832 domain-containing protein [Georgenia phoenicis]|uniref:DUF4832 domain-containing protein n=1 Tax=unclassified Georgenia TaxID=2626815 RepID=UPI0039AF2D08
MTALLVTTACAADDSWTALAPAPPVVGNPLSGWVPFAPEPGDPWEPADPEFPATMEWFYLPVAAVVTGEGEYDWTALEARLEDVASRGRQSVLRLYLDYPGLPTGVPDHLLGEGGIDQSRRYTQHGNDGISFSPDYDDPRVVALLTDLVTALGAEYDGDARLGFVTSGLVGFWGEQHTWPLDGEAGTEDWMPSEATEEELFAAWDAAFDTTPVLARYPSATTAPYAVGFHDDSFAYETLPTEPWHFVSLLEETGLTDRWLTQPIGGELYPALQTCAFSSPLDCPDMAGEPVEDVAAAIEATHVSWLVNDRAYTEGYTGADRERALAAGAAMGEDLTAVAVRFVAHDDGVDVTVRLTNRGVAPFSADWAGELALLDDDGDVLASVPAEGLDLRGLAPGEEQEVRGTLPLPGDGEHLALHVPNPMPGGAPLRLANAGQDAHAFGYLTLEP